MHIVLDWQTFRPSYPEAIVTLGDFDGFHRGHRALLEMTVRRAEKTGLAPVLITYEPSPKKVLQKLPTDSQIYTFEEKVVLLQEFPLHTAVFIRFDTDFARLTAKHFLQEVILKTCKAQEVIIGHDHHFGRNRHGSWRYLQLAGNRYGFSSRRIASVNSGGEPVSSSRIRSTISAGDIRNSNRLLGAPFLVTGTVIRGHGRGRQIGIPTANLFVRPGKLLPATGVYAAMAFVSGKWVQAVVNLGTNPTFGENPISLEAHLMDFDQDIYGQELRLYFCERIRAEKRFASVSELVAEIRTNIGQARKLLRGFKAWN